MSCRHNKNACQLMAVSVIVVIALTLFGCGSPMPFNGEVEFHDISVTIPNNFVRDSTQSAEDIWIFERGGYKAYIILSRSDITGDTTAAVEDYVDLMEERGVDSYVTTFAEKPAVHSTYTKDGVYCQEMLFAQDGSFYAIALSGGNENEFQSILKTVKINEEAL